MKKALFILLSIAVAAGLYAVITGSAHDFSGDAWSGGEICIPCHTPHNADLTVSGSPLWNHEVTTASYTVYANPGSLDATIGQPNGNSVLCLSCHDGTVAVDSYSGSTGSTMITTGDVGTDLSDDHPVSFVMDGTLITADGELQAPPAGWLDGSSRVQCSSCHDVHNTAGFSSLLRATNANSALCLTCHVK